MEKESEDKLTNLQRLYLYLAEELQKEGISQEEISKEINEHFKKEKLDIKEVIRVFSVNADVIYERIIDRFVKYYGDSSQIDWWYNFYGIPLNDRMKTFQLFMNYAHLYFKEVEEIINNIEKDLLEDIKHFEISDTIGNVLINTKSEETKLPYENFFLSGKFKIGKEVYVGILVFNILNEKVMEIMGVRKYVLALKIKRGKEFSFQYDAFYLGEKGFEINNFIYSFANFLNERDVKIQELEFNPKNNLRRKEKGRTQLPRENVIRIYGNIKVYLDRLEDSYYHKLMNSHWVRGHFFHFRNRDKWKRIYLLNENQLGERGLILKEGIIRKWKKPFIRGSGLLTKSSYVLK